MPVRATLKPALLLALAALACSPGLARAADASVYGSSTMIRPADAGVGSATAELTAARNEFEAFQIKIAGALSAADVTLQGPLNRVGGGGSIPAANVQIFREGYYSIGRPSDGELFQADPCSGDCRIPDVLIPDRDVFEGEQRDAFTHGGFSLDIPAGENRVAWIDILVPQNAPAGRYEGVIRVTGAGGFVEDVPVGLEVVAATLPSTSSLDGAFSITFQKLCPAHGGCPANDPWGLYARYARLALEHRVSVDRPAYGDPPNDLARWRTEADALIGGTSAARLPGARLTGIVLNTFHAEVMDNYKTEAARLGVLDKLSFYCDETGRSPALWAACNDAYGVAKLEWEKVGPVVPMHVAKIGTFDDREWARAEGFGVADAIDRLIPIINFFAPKAQEYPGTRPSYEPYLAERERNDLWAYQSCMSSGCTDAFTNEPIWHGWPSYHIDQPASEARAMPWLLHTHDVAGEYYFEMAMDLANAWGGCANRPLGCLFSEGGNGDGTLFYPGTPARIGGTTHIPVETIRLRRIREGREDYEWLELAGAAGNAPQARTVALNLFPKMIDAVATQGEIDAARAALVPLLGGGPAQPQCHGSSLTAMGTPNADALSGGPAVDVIAGLAGNDTIEGFANDDKLCGDDGDDRLLPGDGADIISGGAGTDTVDFEQGTPGVNADLSIGLAGGSGGGDQIISIERASGTSGADSLIGSEGVNTLDGRAGADTLTGGPGVDVLVGGAGADTIFARDFDSDEVTCGDGIDEVFADASDAVALDCETVDRPAGSFCQGQASTAGTGAGDVLNGGPNADAISGLGGDDTLNGLAGGDALCGDEGYDTLSGGSGDDVLDGGPDADAADFAAAPAPVIADLASGTATGHGSDLLVSISDLSGSPHNDGLAGADAANNYLFGAGGHDDLAGRGGNDRLDGGDGDDTLRGGPGDDRLDGQGGHDELSYELATGPVSVNLLAGTSSGDGVDQLFGFEDVTGTPGGDTIAGTAGANFLSGRDGGDTLTGGAGADFLTGGAGGDVLQARDGEIDRVVCGDGADRAVVDTADSVEGDCELVERPTVFVPSPDPVVTPVPTPDPIVTPVPDTTAPVASLRVTSARAGRFLVAVTCSEPCTTALRAQLSARDAKRLRIPRTLGSGRGAGRTFTVRIRLSARARAAVRRARSVRVSVAGSAVDSAGNRRQLSRAVRLRR